MTIFENLEQIYNHLESNEQIELAERLLLKRKLEIGLIEREMKKHKVFFIGSKNYTTRTEDEAIKLAEQDIKNLHPSFNMDISGVRDDN